MIPIIRSFNSASKQSSENHCCYTTCNTLGHPTQNVVGYTTVELLPQDLYLNIVHLGAETRPGPPIHNFHLTLHNGVYISNNTAIFMNFTGTDTLHIMLRNNNGELCSQINDNWSVKIKIS